MIKCFLFIGSLLCAQAIFADCYFEITNSSKWSLNVELGFFGESVSKILIPKPGTTVVLIKGDKQCDARGRGDLGLAYVNLIGGKSRGGWRYLPPSNMVRAVGASPLGSSGALGRSPLGNELFLRNNYKVDSKTFSVEVQNAGRNVSQIGSMD